MNKKLISIVIPLFNKEKSIKETLMSIIQQNYDDYEIVIVDDGSTDTSLGIIKVINNDHIAIYHKENGGPASARNFGVQKASGEWILFLDADDTLEKNVLSYVAENIYRYHDVDVFTYNMYFKSSFNKPMKYWHHADGYIHHPFYLWYIGRIYPRTGNMICKKNVLLSEPYRVDLRRHEDTECTFRIMSKYRLFACSLVLFTYNQDSIAASLKRENIKEDFICQLSLSGKTFGEQMALYKLYKESKIVYPNICQTIYGKDFEKFKYKAANIILLFYKKITDKIFVYLKK